MKLSVVLATFNEEKNIAACLDSIKDIADEIVIVDGSSTDKTVEIAKKYGAEIIVTDNPPIFHINKQKALEKAQNSWILQLDADERVSKQLAQEIRNVIQLSASDLEAYESSLPHKELFRRHQKLLEQRDGRVGTAQGDFVAFFVPRLNYFLGKYLKHGGVYPDGAIRLVKKGKAFFPAKDVHEVMQVDGKVGWLQNPLYHYDSPTFRRYIERNNRYINLIVDEMKQEKLPKNVVQFIVYYFLLPGQWFFMTQIRHKGILDGWQGIVFSFFSALRFPRAYWRYLKH